MGKKSQKASESIISYSEHRKKMIQENCKLVVPREQVVRTFSHARRFCWLIIVVQKLKRTFEKSGQEFVETVKEFLKAGEN